MKIVYRNTKDLIPYVNNTRTHDDKQIKQIMASIKEFGFTNPILIDEQDGIIAGHGRLMAAERMKLNEVPTITLDGLTEAQKKAYIIADNKLALNAGWDEELLKIEIEGLKELDFDIDILGFDSDELDGLFKIEDDTEVVEDDFDEEPPENPISKRGDIWLLGRHRLMCGDSTSDDVNVLMDGKKVVLGHNDPPYGMKKENEGVLNDNLNYDDLLEFNKKWIAKQFEHLEDNGSFYCWGVDEPLMDIYSHILKPMIKTQKATFRNLITWNKGHGQGQLAEEFRSYPIADEKCLFMMCGVQGFNNNADNYFEDWENIRQYLEVEIKKIGESDKIIANALGFKDGRTVNHWWSKSQWTLPTKENYEKLREYAKTKTIDAFKKEYDKIKKEYDEIKKEYYSTRAYFNNTHDNINNVWNIQRTTGDEREQTGGHATPKPLELCQRVIKSSSRENDIVLDAFGGSGSTLIASEQLNRICYMMELDEKYVDVIVNRYINFKECDEDIYLIRDGQKYTHKEALNL